MRLRDRAVSLAQSQSLAKSHRKVWFLFRIYQSLFVLLALSDSLARGQVFYGIGWRGEWRDRERIVISKIETERTIRSIIPIAQTKHPPIVASDLITVFVHPGHEKARIVNRQIGEIFLGNDSQRGDKNRISSNGRTSLRPPYGAICLVPSPWGQPLEGVRVGEARALFASLFQKFQRSSPCKLCWQVPAVLEVNHQFSVLVRIFGDDKVSDDAIFRTNRNVCSLGYVQGILGHPPLFLRIINIHIREADDGESGCCRDGGTVIIKELYKPSNDRPNRDNCYDRPHYVLAVISFFAGFLFLASAGGCWRLATNDAGSGGFLFFLVGCAFVWICYRFIGHGFNLISFEVFPCASLFSPFRFFAFLAHA